MANIIGNKGEMTFLFFPYFTPHNVCVRYFSLECVHITLESKPCPRGSGPHSLETDQVALDP